MIYGYEKHSTWRVLLDGVDFAVVQLPGRYYVSGQEGRYGATDYYLVDKRGPSHGGHGVNDWCKLQDGGRAGKKKKAEWQALVAECDKTGKYPLGMVQGY